MRRRTSAWIAVALGAGLTASGVVLAQQASGPGAVASDSAALYGAGGSRVRYLLRNGLDYIQYQEYERALKFLRDAEVRSKELSSAERLQLVRGSSSAGGLRAVADVQYPLWRERSDAGAPAGSPLRVRRTRRPWPIAAG